MKRKVLAVAALAAVCFTTWAFADNDHRQVNTALVNARQKFFGAENVNPTTGEVRRDRVIFSWATNTTYAVSLRGRVILLDSFVTRLEVTPGRTPFVIQDLVDLAPTAIFLGHGHGDHADNAAFLAHTLTIPIVSSPETCDVMQVDAARIFGAGTTVDCIGAVSRGSAPGAEINHLSLLEPVASITVFKHIHSGRVPADPTFPLVTIQNIPDPRDAAMFPVGIPLSTVLNLTTTGFGGAAGPISLFYQFIVHGDNNFTFVWHNTTGPLKEQGPQLFDIMDALPPTDVEFGSVVSLGFTTNGERDIVMYNQHIKPKVFVPGHMTAVAVESSSLEWKVGYLEQRVAMGVDPTTAPEVRWMVDPNDYLRPLVFDPSDNRWAKHGNGN